MGESILSGLFVLSINWHDCVLLLVGVFNTCTPRKGRRLKLSSTKERNVVSVCDRQRVETWRRPRHALKEMSLFFHSFIDVYSDVAEKSHTLETVWPEKTLDSWESTSPLCLVEPIRGDRVESHGEGP